MIAQVQKVVSSEKRDTKRDSKLSVSFKITSLTCEVYSAIIESG